MSKEAQFSLVATPSTKTPANAMSVDVEDYFHVAAFEGQFKRSDWDTLECRIPTNVDNILELFDSHSVQATFFVLGWVAERFPELVRRIADEGHEVASHGYEHVRVFTQTPSEFREDVVKTRRILEDTTGRKVLGYRAASYSIGEDNLWALDVLAEAGHIYSSSIYPIKHDLYGMPKAPRFPFRVAGAGILEWPVTTVRLFGRTLPCGGGGFFRLFPYAFSRWAIQRVNELEGMPAVFYFHPWELDPNQPRVESAGVRSRFRHYLNLDRMRGRLDRLLGDFQWEPVHKVLQPYLP